MASIDAIRKVLREELSHFARDLIQNEVLVIGDRLDSALKARFDELFGAMRKNVNRSSIVTSDRDDDVGTGTKPPKSRPTSSVAFNLFRVRKSYQPVDFDFEGEFDSMTSDRKTPAVFPTRLLGGLEAEKQGERPSLVESVASQDKNISEPESYHSLPQEDDGVMTLVSATDCSERESQPKATLYTQRSASQRLSTLLFASHRDSPESSKDNSFLAPYVNSDEFNYGSCLFVFLSGISMGLETDYMARHWTEHVPIFYRICDLVFCCIFVVELLLRIYVNGLRFFYKPGWKWNVFDFVIILAQVAEEAVAFHVAPPIPGAFSPTNNISILRIVRIFRVVRILRLARVLHLFGELRLLLVSIADSVRSLFWVVLLLFLLVYVLGVYLTQVVTDYKVLHANRSVASKALDDLEKFYGSVDVSMLTLYETISEGVHWHEVMTPLATEVSPWLKLVFCVYSAFIFFAVLNIVTGAFVESAIRTGTDDKKKILMYQMKQLFQIADADGSGTISWDEFAAQLSNPQMDEYLRAIDLDREEAADLFMLLDHEETGEIDAEDLVHECLRLHGPAKSIDLATFMRAYEIQSQCWALHAKKIESSMAILMQEVRERAQSLGDTELSSRIASMSAKLNEESDEKTVSFKHASGRYS